MSLRPKSLWGQLTLLLVGVLLVAQLLSAVLHFKDRGELLVHAAGFNSAQRISGVVNILDRVSADLRPVIVEELDLPPLRLRLHDKPFEVPEYVGSTTRAKIFHQLLHFNLGRDRSVLIYMPERELSVNQEAEKIWPVQDDSAPHMMRMFSMHHDESQNANVSFIVQVQLLDGQWVSFGYHLPQDLAGWPWDLLVALVILLLAVLLVSYFAVRWLTRPLSTLATAAEAFGKDIHHEPMIESGPTEVRRAAQAFNKMQQRLARFVEERTRILAAISHDLKTPITRMRLRVENISDQKLKNKFDGDLQEMQLLVQSSLDFMRGITLPEDTQLIDVNALIESLSDDIQDTSGQVIAVTNHVLEAYRGKPLAVKRCISNVLENAARYGSNVRVQLEEDKAGVVIVVTDEGPGIAKEHIDKVFEPYYRVESSRNTKTGGTGLGLSIARNIAQGHGGDLVLENRTDTSGIRATIHLPR